MSADCTLINQFTNNLTLNSRALAKYITGYPYSVILSYVF